MTPAAKRQITAVVALLFAGGAVAYLLLGNLQENLVYHLTPSDLVSKSETGSVRLGGMVQAGSVHWDPEDLTLRFTMGEKPEPGDPSVVVISKGAPPQMFKEGIGCIVEGKYDGKVFHSDRLLVKHSNEYRPPAEGEDPRDKFRTLLEPPAGMGSPKRMESPEGMRSPKEMESPEGMRSPKEMESPEGMRRPIEVKNPEQVSPKEMESPEGMRNPKEMKETKEPAK